MDKLDLYPVHYLNPAQRTFSMQVCREVGTCTAWEGIVNRWVWLYVEGTCLYVGTFLFFPWSGTKRRGVGVQRRVFLIDLFGSTI